MGVLLGLVSQLSLSSSCKETRVIPGKWCSWIKILRGSLTDDSFEIAILDNLKITDD
jgi:hypothetical protein